MARSVLLKWVDREMTDFVSLDQREKNIWDLVEVWDRGGLEASCRYLENDFRKGDSLPLLAHLQDWL